MKCRLKIFLLLVFVPLAVSAQSLDLIITADGDSIACKIDSIANDIVYFVARKDSLEIALKITKDKTQKIEYEVLDSRHFHNDPGTININSKSCSDILKWYYRHHKATNPNRLTVPQLELSKKKSTGSILLGSAIIVSLLGCSTAWSTNQAYGGVIWIISSVLFLHGYAYGVVKIIVNFRRVKLINHLIESKKGKIETSINPVILRSINNNHYSFGLTASIRF